MPGLNCACGCRISFGQIPCKDEWLFISDERFDGVSGTLDSEELYKQMSSFLKCPSCGRLWLFWNGYSSEPQEFIPVGGLRTGCS